MNKTIFISVLVSLFGLQSLFAQNCKVYIPSKSGTELVYHNYDKKDKLTGITKTKVTSVKEKGDTTYFHVHQEILDDNKELILQKEYTFKCSGNKFFLDMENFLNDQQMEAYEDMDMDIEVNETYIPANLEAGQQLDDGSIIVNINTGAATIKSETTVKNRKVMALEDVTVPAGTYKAAKISSTIESKMSFVKTTAKTIAWYTEGIGTVRSETYNKRGKLMSYMVLHSISQE
jgi:hypothetical protein